MAFTLNLMKKAVCRIINKLKNCLKPRFFIAIIICLISCTALFIIEYRLYAEAESINTLSIIWATGLLLSAFLGLGQKNYKRLSRNGKIASAFCIALVVSYCYFFSSDHSYRLYCWQCLAIIPAGFIFEILQHENTDAWFSNANFVRIVSPMILLATIIFLLITRPVTVDGARRVLLDEGYQNPSFVFYQSDYVWNVYFTGGDLPVNSNPVRDGRLGMYLFFVKQDSKDFGIFVDVESGVPLMKMDLEEYSPFSVRPHNFEDD